MIRRVDSIDHLLLRGKERRRSIVVSHTFIAVIRNTIGVCLMLIANGVGVDSVGGDGTGWLGILIVNDHGRQRRGILQQSFE